MKPRLPPQRTGPGWKIALWGRVGGRMNYMPREEGNTDERFLEVLSELIDGDSNRNAFVEILDSVIAATGAERAFLFQLARPGGFHVPAARNRDREDIDSPLRRMSHFAISRMLSAAGPWALDDARTDRRYRTEDSKDGLKSPLSIRICPLFSGEEVIGGIYIDHRFITLEAPAPGKDPLVQWATLASVAVAFRAQAVDLRNLRKRRKLVSAGGSPPAPAEKPAAGARRGFAGVLDEFYGLNSANPDMLDLFDTVRNVSDSEIPVMIWGESGTGKTLLANAVHQVSARAKEPFISLSCGTIPDTLIESELMGHDKGAFTGAESERVGLLAQADRGTFFLDNIEDMSLDMQTRLLRVLEDGRVRPLGGEETLVVDIRLIAASGIELERRVSKGEFRQDLYYRIKGLALEIPPLRDRWEDIPALAEILFSRYSSDARVPVFAKGVAEQLARHHWPGNVRELENEMRRLATLGDGNISLDDLAPELTGRGRRALSEGDSRNSLERIVNEVELEAIESALKRFGGNKSRAAQWLSITRKALYRRLRKYGIHSSGSTNGGTGAGDSSPEKAD